jgi:hypothetical protein
MHIRSRFPLIWSLILVAQAANIGSAQQLFRAVLTNSVSVTSKRLNQWREAGFKAIVLELVATDRAGSEAEARAATAIRQSEFDLFYWIEIGRCPPLADSNPQWMGSLQGHQEWRRHFPDVREPQANEVVKCYPWVPILYQESFNAHLKRVQSLMEGKPRPQGIFLNDLQGVPSACGCGNTLCRWTADYGDKLTATPLGDEAAARFVSEVGKSNPGIEIIPVWVTECEQADQDNFCCGVGCFEGICWRAYTRQLMPLARRSARIGVLVPFRSFRRDLDRFEKPAGWINHSLSTFQTMPPRRGGTRIDPSRLIAVLQGWDVTPAEIGAQIDRVAESDAGGYIVAFVEIVQSWTPRIVAAPSGRAPASGDGGDSNNRLTPAAPEE